MQGSTILGGPKMLGFNIFWGSQFFRVNKFLGSNFVGGNNFLGGPKGGIYGSCLRRTREPEPPLVCDNISPSKVHALPVRHCRRAAWKT
jgi:hypothetical protein